MVVEDGFLRAVLCLARTRIWLQTKKGWRLASDVFPCPYNWVYSIFSPLNG